MNAASSERSIKWALLKVEAHESGRSSKRMDLLSRCLKVKHSESSFARLKQNVPSDSFLSIDSIFVLSPYGQ